MAATEVRGLDVLINWFASGWWTTQRFIRIKRGVN